MYANYGRKADFDALIAAGTNFTNTIALVRYGGVFRGLKVRHFCSGWKDGLALIFFGKVKAAGEAGAIGILIYSDPRDDGSVTVENGYKV